MSALGLSKNQHHLLRGRSSKLPEQHKSGGEKTLGQPFCCASNATEVTMNFRIRGLEARQFDHLFTLSDAELAERGAARRIADGPRPCRISLSDANPGD